MLCKMTNKNSNLQKNFFFIEKSFFEYNWLLTISYKQIKNPLDNLSSKLINHWYRQIALSLFSFSVAQFSPLYDLQNLLNPTGH